MFYKSERSETTNNSDRNTSWIGKLALMYPSDYIYTYSLSIDDICYSTPGNCKISTSGIPTFGWLYRSEYHQWTLMPNSSYKNRVFLIHTNGDVFNYDYVNNAYGISPNIYLKPEVKIKQGDGTIDNPYVFEL